MVAIGGSVGLLGYVVPGALQRAFGIPPAEIRGAGEVGWRLFAARNLYLTVAALRGHEWAIRAYGPLQGLDQVVFWHALVTRSVPRRTAVLAIAASGAIVALDVQRRRG